MSNETAAVYKAIVVKYLPVTNHKPSRFKAYTDGPSDCKSVTVNTNNHSMSDAALMLAKKLDWYGEFIEGALPNGDHVFVFTHSAKHKIT